MAKILIEIIRDSGTVVMRRYIDVGLVADFFYDDVAPGDHTYVVRAKALAGVPKIGFCRINALMTKR